MIKANELRIGNCVKLNNSYTTLVPRDFQRYCKSYGIFEEFEPIPLTEEWLLKFGYRKNTPFFTDGSIIEFYENNGMLFCELPDNNTILHIKYVHQLQNLYFALTGEELVFSTEP